MSRIGRSPVNFDSTVKITVGNDNSLVVKGAKTSQVVKMRPEVKAQLEGNKVTLIRQDDSRLSRSLHGLYRALLQNAVMGVTRGFSKTLDLVGVGYRASVSGKKLEMTLGYSHPVVYAIPDGIEIKVEKQTQVTITGASKELVGQVAAKIRSFKKPEPFLGKGIKYSDEVIRRKAGKAGKAGATK